MADRISFRLRDATTGAALLGMVPSLSFVDYRLAESPFTQRTQPTFVEIGGGEYGFTPTDADEAAGVVFLVDGTAAAWPRRFSGAVYTPAAPFLGWHLEDSTGALWGGAAPTNTLWSDFAAAARTQPTILSATAYLFVAKPSAADLAVDVAFVFTSPAGAYPEDFDGSLERPTGPSISASPGLQPDALAIEAFREYLLRHLPAKVAQLNALRPAVLKSALAEPFTIPVGAVLRLSASSQEAVPTSAPLTAGSVTAAQLAADITAAAVPGLTASSSDGRVVLTSDTAPAAGVPSVVVVARDGATSAATTGANLALGWSEGGEHVELRALVAPSWRGVVDGRPLTAPDMGQGFWVMLGNRTTRATHPGIRRDTYQVTIQTEIWRPFSAHGAPHRSREAISSCVRAVRELINSADGRYLGRQGANDVQLADASEANVSGDPLSLSDVPGVMFDVARLTLTCRVFQRPD